MSEPESFPPSLPINPQHFAWQLQNRPINHVEGYEHGVHTKTYLRQRAEQVGLRIEQPQRDELHEAAIRAAGYASFEKFTRHMAGWHDLARPVPRGYGDFIGVTPGELLAAVDEDRRDHGRALATAPVLCSWTLRRMAGVYEVRPFPAACQGESACVEYVRAACVHRRLHASIHIQGVKTLYLEPPDGHLLVTLYTPHVKLTRVWIVFGDDGRNEGTMRLA